MKSLKAILLGSVCLGAAACEFMAVQAAPAKVGASTRSEMALEADKTFWKVFHAGDYQRIDEALNALTAAYLLTPNDAVTAAHIGWLHIWRLSERARLDQIPPTITDDAVLSRKYFQEAVTLHPGEARYLGFLAGSTLAEASIHQDEKLKRRGYYMMQDAIAAWPEFNLFSGGYVMSGRPADSKQFREGLDWIWRNVEACSNEPVDRVNPDFSRYTGTYTTEGPKRACYNSKIAPHNFEGFFLNLGDMLVKSGDWELGKRAYSAAKFSPDYSNWKFQNVLEERIANAQTNVAAFNEVPVPGQKERNPIMFASAFACMGCHQD